MDNIPLYDMQIYAVICGATHTEGELQKYIRLQGNNIQNTAASISFF